MRRRTVYLVCVVLLVAVGLGSDSPRECDDATQYAGIEGTWRRTELVNDGKEAKLNIQQTITIRGAVFTISYGDGSAYQGSLRIDPTRNPSHLDHTPASGALANRTLKWIYQIDRDTLTIAGNPDGLFERRPQGFNDKGIIVWTYKRVR